MRMTVPGFALGSGHIQCRTHYWRIVTINGAKMCWLFQGLLYAFRKASWGSLLRLSLKGEYRCELGWRSRVRSVCGGRWGQARLGPVLILSLGDLRRDGK